MKNLIEIIKGVASVENLEKKWSLSPVFPDVSEAESNLLQQLSEGEFGSLDNRSVFCHGVEVGLSSDFDPYLIYLIASEVYEYGDAYLINKYLSLKEDAKVIVLGGGIGIIASVIGKVTKTKNVITIYEPNFFLLKHLRKTQELNNLNFDLKQEAISNEKGVCTLNLSKEFWASGLQENTYKKINSVVVPKVLWQDALEGNTIAFIDIEGEEKNLFKSAIPESITDLFVEVHIPSLGTTSGCLVINDIVQQGFDLIDVNGLTYYFKRKMK